MSHPHRPTFCRSVATAAAAVVMGAALSACGDSTDGDDASTTLASGAPAATTNSDVESTSPLLVPTTVVVDRGATGDDEGNLACSFVETALIGADEGAPEADINSSLASAAEQAALSAGVVGTRGADLLPASAADADWQERSFDFLDVCAETGYEPIIGRPS